MADILLHQSSVRATAALTGSLIPSYEVRVVETWKELERALGEMKPQACILDAFHHPALPLPALRRLRGNHPTVALVIASDFSGRDMELYNLGRLSVDGVIRLDTSPSSREILRIMDGAIAGALAQNVVSEVARDLPPLAQEAIRWAIEHAETGSQVSPLAASLGLSSRVLLRELRTLGLASPRTLLLWGRLLRASHFLERTSATVEAIAFRLGYATGGALGKAFKKHVGCSPTGLLQRGGVAWTLEAFQRRGLRRPTLRRERWARSRSSKWRDPRGVGGVR